MRLDIVVHSVAAPVDGIGKVLLAWVPLLLPVAIAFVSWWYARVDRARIIKATLVTQIMNLHDSVLGELEHAKDRANADSWFVVLPYLNRDIFPLVTSGRVSQQVAQQVVRMHFAYRTALATIKQMSERRQSGEGIDDLLVVNLANDKDRTNYIKTLDNLNKATIQALSAMNRPRAGGWSRTAIGFGKRIIGNDPPPR